MGHVRIIVEHDKIEYSGPFDGSGLFKAIDYFLYERGFDKRQEKDFEQNTPEGKFIEWQISPWKRITDYIRHMVKIRVLGYNIARADVAHNGKKAKIDNGRVLIIIDGFIEHDYYSFWEDRPMLHFLRTIYDYFVFKIYTERFEQRLIHDINQLHEHIEKFFNVYRHYKVISKQSP